MAVVATGFFDGVHLGHRRVLSALTAAARERGERALVLTFWPHPRTVLQDGARELRLLTSLDEKKALLEACGVDGVEVIPFSREFSALSAEAYLREVLIGRYGATALLLGYDNRLGSDRRSPDEIAAIAESLGLEVIRPGAVSAGSRPISSTRIRAALAEGDAEAAAAMLGRPYSLTGVVVAGNRLGRTLGFPTANMQLYEPLKLLPKAGVYLVGASLQGRALHGMCNIGRRPTVSAGENLSIETHLFDFDEEIYGLPLQISFLGRIRDERRFDSLDALRGQLCADRERCLALLAEKRG